MLTDVETGTNNLVALAAAADGLQYSSDELLNTRHFSNVLFNIMRGGIFDDNYQIGKRDFIIYFKNASVVVYEKTNSYLLLYQNNFRYSL